MEDILSPGAPGARRILTPDAVKKATTDAQKLGRDVKEDVEEAVSRGRGIADDVVRAAADDLSSQGRETAERARAYMREGRERASRMAGRVSDYADENTAIVAAGAFGLGLLLGYLVTRRR
jgi:ElaB/YqjD/DUF883 family membrane-anchored ribosome-binding protein